MYIYRRLYEELNNKEIIDRLLKWKNDDYDKYMINSYQLQEECIRFIGFKDICKSIYYIIREKNTLIKKYMLNLIIMSHYWRVDIIIERLNGHC